MSLRKPFLYTFAIALGLLCATGVLAWTGPSLGFPGGNANAPLNVSGSGQIKSGVLMAGGLSAPVFCIGVSCITSWAAAGGTQWTINGSSIYYNGGNVGIGTASPGQKLDVNGYVAVRSTNGEGGTIQLQGNNGVNMWLENLNGTFRLLNSPWTAGIFNVDQAGNTTISGALNTGGAISVGGALITGFAGGYQIGNSVAAGIYFDGASLAMRPSGSNGFYIQDNGGSRNWALIGAPWGGSIFYGTMNVVSTLTVGSATYNTNGDIYMPWAGKYLSTYLGGINTRQTIAFGGEYTTYSNGVCAWANAFTGGCSCPGYAPTPRLAGETASNLGGGWLNVIYYCTG